MSDLLDGTGHPARFGYVKCSRCGTMRPKDTLVDRDWTWHHEDHGPIRMDGPVCIDTTWCDKQASKATGLDAHGDAT